MAIVVDAFHKCNIGKIVNVIEPHSRTGDVVLPTEEPVWLVRCSVPLTWTAGKQRWRRKSGPVPDSALQPIRGLAHGDSTAQRQDKELAAQDKQIDFQLASSTTSESPERKSTASASPAQQMPKQLYDLQNLPEDPALGAIRAGEAARRNRESSLLAQVEVAVFPEVLPKSARLIARAEWTVSRARSTVQSYLLSSNQQRSHWVLWVRRWDAESRKWSAAEVQCGIPRKGSTAAQAALTLMSALWRRERWDSDLGRVDACWPGRLLGTGGLDELVDNVWPRDKHEYGGSHGHGCR